LELQLLSLMLYVLSHSREEYKTDSWQLIVPEKSQMNQVLTNMRRIDISQMMSDFRMNSQKCPQNPLILNKIQYFQKITQKLRTIGNMDFTSLTFFEISKI